jgi:hypothetical protein
MSSLSIFLLRLFFAFHALRMGPSSAPSTNGLGKGSISSHRVLDLFDFHDFSPHLTYLINNVIF